MSDNNDPALLPGFHRRHFLQLFGAAVPVLAGAGLGLNSFGASTAVSTSGITAGTEAGAWPERGNFGYQAVVGPHQASARAMLDDRPFFGLVPESTFLYGCLRDESGNMYELCRNMARQKGVGRSGLFLETSAGNDALRMDPSVGAAAATSDDCLTSLDGDTASCASAPSVSGKPFHITFSPTRCSWVEQDLCDLTGELIGPGLQWYVPEPNIGLFYVSQIFQLSGTLRGKKVRGMIGFDQTYLHQGAFLYGGQDPLTGPKQHRAWYTWATRYKDGSVDAGHFMLGHDRLGFALLTNEKQELTLVTSVKGNIQISADKTFPAGITIKFNDQTWEFLPDPKGRMPDLLGMAQPSTPQMEGRWRRVGDKRVPDVWFAWGEVAPAHGLAYEKRLRY